MLGMQRAIVSTGPAVLSFSAATALQIGGYHNVKVAWAIFGFGLLWSLCVLALWRRGSTGETAEGRPRIDFVRPNPDTVAQEAPAIASRLSVSNTASEPVNHISGRKKYAGQGMFQRPELINRGDVALLRPNVAVEVLDGGGSRGRVSSQIPFQRTAMPDVWQVGVPMTFDLVQRLDGQGAAFLWSRTEGRRVGEPLEPGQYLARIVVSGDGYRTTHEFDLRIPERGMPTIARRDPSKSPRPQA